MNEVSGINMRMCIDQHFLQNFTKIRKNKAPEYEGNIILLYRKNENQVCFC